MNRKILFKAKRKDNGEWVEGDLIQLLGEQGKGRKFIINNKFGACIDNKGNFINTESPFVNEVIPETICQYTGLDDKNDKKIFDGDILNKKHYQDNKPYGSTYKTVKWENTRFNIINCNNWKVIGNIHDKEVK